MTRRVALIACALLVVACSDNNEVCHDGVDNDNDTLADCADDACAGASCGPNGLVCGTDQKCSACSGNGGAAEAAEATCGDGFDNDCDGKIDCADPDCQPADGASGKVCDELGRTCSAPDALGRSVCGTSGTGGGGGVSLSYIRLVSAEHDVLGARGSGYQEQSLLTFEVRAADGSPAAGLRVSFTHESHGGSFIGAAPVCTGAEPPVCAAEGNTDGEGRVRVLLTSGMKFAILSVRAEVSADGVTRHLVAGGFSVVGAKPNGAHFSVDCRPYNVPALTNDDCLYSRYAGTARSVDCTATLGDRHGNLVAVPTLVGFLSEAGGIAPAAFTPAYVPATRAQPGLGQAIGVLEVYGGTLPWDVAPFPGLEASVPGIDFGCGPRTANPRDGLVSVLAMAQGEEGYVDQNLNAVYDPGEPFIDLGEPFLDVDDDGVHGEHEWYADLNEDEKYTGPNGVWDASTVLWAEGRVLYTGHAARARNAAGNELFSRYYLAGTPPTPTPPAPDFLVRKGPPATTQFYDVFFTDQNLNPLTSFSSFEIEALAGNVSAKLTRPTHTADSLATGFRMLYCDTPAGNGVCNDGPADQACTTAPCYRVPDIGFGFLYGNYATAAITCAEVGSDVVSIYAEVDGVASVLPIRGRCDP